VRTELEGAALDTRDLPHGGFGDGVFVAPLSVGRGLRFRQVVVVGLADGLVPGRGGEDGLLGDDLRLTDTSGALRTRADRRESTRRDLWSAVAAGTEGRVGTVPRADPRTGRAQVPSRWLRRLVDGETTANGVDSFAAGLVAAAPALSARELELREMARWVGAGGDPTLAPAASDVRLSRGLEASRGRAAARGTRFDGVIGPGLVAAFDPGTPVSATRFETYALCPRRYLFDRVLHVAERVRPEELVRIEPVTKGSLVHGILEDYVAERVAGAPRSLDRLLAIAERWLDEAEAAGLVGKPLLWRMDRATIVRDLVRFDAEEGDTRPVAAELAFGDEEGAPAVTVLLDDGRRVPFRGSVDRIDRTAGGRLLVSDYKTGRQARLNELLRDPVAGGRLLQLPLYALAAQGRFGGRSPVHTRYWLLSGERSAPSYHLVVTPEVEARFRHVVGLIAEGVESGCFPGVPGAPRLRTFANCATCDFDSVCPTARDRQWGRKYNSPEFRSLVNLVNGDVPEGLSGAVAKGFVDPDRSESP
jgi:ATP-dependent helicase/nuclease subunit B